MSKNIDSLKTFGTWYFKEELFKPLPPVVKDIVYGKDDLQIGRRLDGSIYTLDLRESCRILFVGATRAGKTWVLRAISDRLYQTGRSILFLNDSKNEFHSSIDPVQKKFEHLLLPGETPAGFKVVTLRPTFFKTVVPDLHPSNFWYSVNMRDLSKADFMTMMNSPELTINQQVALELIYQELMNRYREDQFVEFSNDLINDIIDEIDDLSSVQKTSMKFKFRPIEHSHFFEERYQRSIVSLIKKGYAPAINMENFDSFGKGAFLFPEVTLNIVLREAIMARRRGEIPPLWIIFDEASRFIGNRKSGSLKESVLQSVDLDARYNLSYCLSEDTPIITSNGRKMIKDLDEKADEVVSWNFDGNKYETKKFKKFHTGKKKVIKIKCGRTGSDFMVTKDHILYVWDGDKIIEKKAGDLKVGDELVKYGNPKEKIFHPSFKREWSDRRRLKQSEREKEKRRLNPEFYQKKNEEFAKNRLGTKQTEEHIKKRFESREGWKHSDESIKKMSEVHTIIQSMRSEEDKKRYGQRMSVVNKGRKQTDEHRIKRMSNASECPNRLEKYCIEQFQKNGINLEFCGDSKNRKMGIEGRFPDFVNESRKVIVEVFCTYWKKRFWGSVETYKKIRASQFPDYKIYFFTDKEIYSDGFIEEVKKCFV